MGRGVGPDTTPLMRARPRTTSDLSLKTATDGARTYWRHGQIREDADVYMLARTARARSKERPK